MLELSLDTVLFREAMCMADLSGEHLAAQYRHLISSAADGIHTREINVQQIEKQSPQE